LNTLSEFKKHNMEKGDDDSHMIMGPDEMKKNAQKEIEKIFKKLDGKK